MEILEQPGLENQVSSMINYDEHGNIVGLELSKTESIKKEIFEKEPKIPENGRPKSVGKGFESNFSRKKNRRRSKSPGILESRLNKKKGIQVFARVRPNFRDEIDELNCVEILDKENMKVNDGYKLHKFNFDYIFDEYSTQEDVYYSIGYPMVQEFLKGYNSAIMVYGQSGSGKTHTILGPGYDNIDNIKKSNAKLRGIVPRYMKSIFDYVYNNDNNYLYDIRASFIEIYKEEVKDLLEEKLKDKKIKIFSNKDSGLVVSNASEMPVVEVEEVLELIEKGSKIRKMAKTNLNEHSSRSHAIFVISIFITDMEKGTKRAAQLILADLAGSENILKSGAVGERFIEASQINKSLLSLGIVIDSIIQKKKHIPYRDSKLTRLLQNCLGGNSYTALILCCSQSVNHSVETLATMKFGERALRIENKPVVNEELSAEELKKILAQTKEQVEILKDDYYESCSKINELENTLFHVLLSVQPNKRSYFKKKFNIQMDLYNPQNKNYFQKIGANAFAYIFTFMLPWECGRMSRVCKLFNKWLQSDYLWKYQINYLISQNLLNVEDPGKIRSYYVFFMKHQEKLAEIKKKAKVVSTGGGLYLFKGTGTNFHKI